MRLRRLGILVAVSASALVLAACGSNGPSGGSAPTASGTDMMTSSPMMSGEPMSGQFGTACSQIPATGMGSLQGMAADPVATAASHNPMLTQLVTAIGDAHMGDTLNNAKDITVFAPVNDAFAKVPAVTMNGLMADPTSLMKLLQYHVVPQRITPQQLSNGTFTTLDGATMTTSGSGQDFTVNGSAHIVCGNIQTANATVYLVDTVLMPPMMTSPAEPMTSMTPMEPMTPMSTPMHS